MEKVPPPPSRTAQSPGPVPPQEVTQAISDPSRAWQGASAVGPCSLPGPGGWASTDSRPRDQRLPVLHTPHRADPQPPKFTDRTPLRSWAQEPTLQRQAPARPLLDPPWDARPKAPRAAVKRERAMCSRVPFPQSLGSVCLSVHWMGRVCTAPGWGTHTGPEIPVLENGKRTQTAIPAVCVRADGASHSEFHRQLAGHVHCYQPKLKHLGRWLFFLRNKPQFSYWEMIPKTQTCFPF